MLSNDELAKYKGFGRVDVICILWSYSMSRERGGGGRALIQIGAFGPVWLFIA